MEPKRITLVADELRGLQGGGIGTATSYLALALARMGHVVAVLYVAESTRLVIDEEWRELYDRAGVVIHELPQSDERVEPAFFGRMRDVQRALQADPPDVVITQDLGAPTYVALRLRQSGLAFEKTAFVVFCHGTRRWITDVSRKVRVLPGALAVTILEQATIELADAAVSPSSYLVDWMRGQGWRLPESVSVIPYLTRSAATGDGPPATAAAGNSVERVVFFGRLEERKGLRPFADGLNKLAPVLLRGIELEFIGWPTKRWSSSEVEALLSRSTRATLRSISFETDLDQQEALARLRRPGTLAIMPSLEDNSPNTVYECLEHGIPFLASSTGGIGELVAARDRERVLFEPTGTGVEDALKRALAREGPLEAVHPAFDPLEPLQSWRDIVRARPQKVARARVARPEVDVIVVHRRSLQALSRCLTTVSHQTYDNFRIIVTGAGVTVQLEDTGDDTRPLLVHSERATVEAARQRGLSAGSATWVLFLDEEDEPREELLETLVRAQAMSGADVVSCGLQVTVRSDRVAHFFTGEPRGLGVLSNAYGTVALLRRELIAGLASDPSTRDPDWPLLARLSASGARVVSVPLPLVNRRQHPGTLERDHAGALLVLDHLERVLPNGVRSLARLSGYLAAGSDVLPPMRSDAVLRRARRILRSEGPIELARRVRHRALHRIRRRP